MKQELTCSSKLRQEKAAMVAGKQRQGPEVQEKLQ